MRTSLYRRINVLPMSATTWRGSINYHLWQPPGKPHFCFYFVFKNSRKTKYLKFSCFFLKKNYYYYFFFFWYYPHWTPSLIKIYSGVVPRACKTTFWVRIQLPLTLRTCLYVSCLVKRLSPCIFASVCVFVCVIVCVCACVCVCLCFPGVWHVFIYSWDLFLLNCMLVFVVTAFVFVLLFCFYNFSNLHICVFQCFVDLSLPLWRFQVLQGFVVVAGSACMPSHVILISRCVLEVFIPKSMSTSLFCSQKNFKRHCVITASLIEASESA